MRGAAFFTRELEGLPWTTAHINKLKADAVGAS
jgi:hypothetical protein